MRLRDYHSDKVVPEARNLSNPAQAKRSGAQCGVGEHTLSVRACRRYATVFLLALLMMFSACEKQEEPAQEEPQTPVAPVTTSDVDIQGTWECIYPEETDEASYLRITFFEHYYSIECDGAYYIERASPQSQWPSGGYFTWQRKANYLIHSEKFYLWHNVKADDFWAEIPYCSNIPPTFDVSLNGDTLNLYCIYTRENCPDLDLPEETQYSFVKLNQ